ncbi:hypothetical protein M438DRAFT_344334, partial [Aureobasidium pullulans EXF-150]
MTQKDQFYDSNLILAIHSFQAPPLALPLSSQRTVDPPLWEYAMICPIFLVAISMVLSRIHAL